MQETIDTISILREKEDHKVLGSLETVLRNSVDDVISIANDISQAEVWIKDITDILFGKIDKKWKRNTEDYKNKTSSIKIKNQLSNYIFTLCEDKEKDSPKEELEKLEELNNKTKKELKELKEKKKGIRKEEKEFKNRSKRKYSDFLCNIIDHMRKIYNNWNEHLFTCYDHKFFPNTNLEIEISHSRMKRKHRRITWLKNSHKFLLIHWEHFAFLFDLNHSYETLLSILQSANYEKIKEKLKLEKIKSKERWRNRLTIKNISKRLEDIVNDWGN